MDDKAKWSMEQMEEGKESLMLIEKTVFWQLFFLFEFERGVSFHPYPTVSGTFHSAVWQGQEEVEGVGGIDE